MTHAQLLLCLSALAHPQRWAIFDMLMEGVQCNCEISAHLDLSLSLTSHHIRRLSQAGLVRAQRDLRDGRWIYYSVDEQTLTELQSQLNQLLDARRIQPRQPSCGPQPCVPAERVGASR